MWRDAGSWLDGSVYEAGRVVINGSSTVLVNTSYQYTPGDVDLHDATGYHRVVSGQTRNLQSPGIHHRRVNIAQPKQHGTIRSGFIKLVPGR